jgi:hypothetical protein
MCYGGLALKSHTLYLTGSWQGRINIFNKAEGIEIKRKIMNGSVIDERK